MTEQNKFNILNEIIVALLLILLSQITLQTVTNRNLRLTTTSEIIQLGWRDVCGMHGM